MATKLSVALFLAGIGTATAAQQPAPTGDAVYAKYCAACHEQVGARIPTREALTKKWRRSMGHGK